MRTPKRQHEALILFTVQAYLERSIAGGITIDLFHRQIVGAIEAWKTMRRFSIEEVKLITEIGNDEYMQKLKQQEISFIVYALELMKQWADNAGRNDTINVSKKKLKRGRATFAIDMLSLKKRDIEKYKETKQIIDDSVVNAKHFYSYTLERLENESKTTT